MKELSIEEKAIAYDYAYKKVAVRFGSNVADEIFIKESEDERIRLKLIEAVKGDMVVGGTKDKQLAIAWLEKQGEKKSNPVLDIEIPFGAKDSELQEASYYIPEGFHAEIEGNRVVIKRGEQNPAWSEEDDAVLDALIRHLEGEDIHVSPHLAVKCLKSLKDRHTWKPSDEQMVAIQEAINIVGVLTITGSKINSLYQDLKKLREG